LTARSRLTKNQGKNNQSTTLVEQKILHAFNPDETIVVLDFETTGMDPEQGDRVIEIGAVLLRGQTIIDRFQSLINPGFLVTREIESLTGITNTLLKNAPPAATVVGDFVTFISHYPLVAHNASFDQKFLAAELAHIGKRRPLDFGCTLLIARRIYPEAFNYKLETLIRHKNLAVSGQFHRALADAEMAASLWLKEIEDLKTDYGFETISFDLLKDLGKISRDRVHDYLRKTAKELHNHQIDTTGNLFG
jgi:DNA polymerase-3 subunit epsilon